MGMLFPLLTSLSCSTSILQCTIKTPAKQCLENHPSSTVYLCVLTQLTFSPITYLRLISIDQESFNTNKNSNGYLGYLRLS